jgi:MSHA biogenesis protein MshK
MRHAIAALCAIMLAGSALAQPMADPMRPPAIGPAAAPGGNATAPAVQMIMIAPQRRYAVIDGYPVVQGGRVRDARVVRIEETQVTLRGGTGETTVLKLLPQAHKTIAAPPRLARGGAPVEDEEK